MNRDPLFTFHTVFPRHLPAIATHVMHLYRQLRAFERFEPQRQDTLIAGQLAHLFAHARRCSPYWAERILDGRAAQRSPQEMLQDIPPLTRKELQANQNRIVAEFPQRAELGIVRNTTSGSTGTPVTVELARNLYTPLYHAVTLLNAAWNGIEAKKSLGVLSAKTTDADRAPLGAPFRWFERVGVGFRYCTRDREIAEIFDHCVRKRPDYIQSGPNTALRLALYARDHGRRDLQLEHALTIGATVTPETRAVVKEHLGARIVDRYSCEETGYIAIQCGKHDHYHVVTPMTLVEIVDESGRPCPIGRPGRILITSPQSYAMPLIRYDIGDRGEWGDPCDCGVRLPVIKTIWGRSRDLIVTPDGRQTYARIYARDFDDLKALQEYRFVLHQNSIIDAQIRARGRSRELEAAITDRVQRAIGYAYPVRIRYVDQIDWASNWKQESFAVSDKPLPAAEPVLA